MASDHSEHYVVETDAQCAILRLTSADGTNKLGLNVIDSLINCFKQLRPRVALGQISGLIISGNQKFFSAGADLNEIARLSGSEALEFSRLGQKLTWFIDRFPVPVVAAIRGYCMGGGMDLALACDYRIAASNAVFGHRGASLGVITGWGGTQRLPRLIGKPRALQMFLLAETVNANQAVTIGLVNEIAEDPICAALQKLGGAISGNHYRQQNQQQTHR
jgi:enoyl-CoA hydratase